MSWHVELSEAKLAINGTLKIWNDEDELDADLGTEPVLCMKYGDALLEYGHEYMNDNRFGVHWSSMDEFNDEFIDTPAYNVALMCFQGKRIDGQEWAAGFDPHAPYYGVDENGNITSMTCRNEIAIWLDSMINFNDFTGWLCRIKL